MSVKTSIKDLNFEIFKVKDVLYEDRGSSIGAYVVKDTNKNNGVVRFKMLESYFKKGAITFSTTANGNVFYQPDDFIIEDKSYDSLIVLRMKTCPLEINENVSLFLVTVLKKCCEGRNVGTKHNIIEIMNWKIALPARRFTIDGKISKPVVDYQVMDAFMRNIKKQEIMKLVMY